MASGVVFPRSRAWKAHGIRAWDDGLGPACKPSLMDQLLLEHLEHADPCQVTQLTKLIGGSAERNYMADGVKIGGVKRGLSRRQLLGGMGALAAGAAHGQIRVHRKPKPLPKGAVTQDWAALLGPSHNAVSTETMLSRKLPPSLVWEFAKGTGYASPAVAGERLVFLHRLGNEEIVECLHPETASSQWQFRYATAFEDRYGYNNGPRSSPVIDAIDGGRVYTMAAEGQLHCVALGLGRVVWKSDPWAA